ncbi:hypothetical protein LWM68_14510 [Niabella sp. W65]|nr:hypothetical protein [Niabella sp. W65]MCH7363854.1 hypothetical protein [Niabella sp. W65]ULT39761.1 hypothetical protein KRR40_33360 [Niabella sp. I65]
MQLRILINSGRNSKGTIGMAGYTPATQTMDPLVVGRSAVDEKGLSWNLEQYQKAGLGGVEITPIYGVYGEEKHFVDFLSPRWMQLFAYTLKESKRLGLGVDLANGTGWPFGGPWVTDADASKAVFHKIFTLEAGRQLAERVIFEREGFVRTANGKR